MEKRDLGKTGLRVSPLGLGTVKFGRNEGVKYPAGFQIPEESALADLLALAQDLGINLLDTAPAYGTSEEKLGRLLKGRREKWIIAGKAGEDYDGGCSLFNFTPEHFEKSLNATLKKLNTDYLDILLIHSDGQDMKILSNDSLIAAMQGFKKRGLVRAIGASTKTPEGGLKALELMDIAMITYNPAHRQEEPVLDMATKNGKGVLLKKILASGHLEKLGKSGDPLQEACDFAFGHPGTGAAIIGTINPQHLKQNAAAVEKTFARLRASEPAA